MINAGFVTFDLETDVLVVGAGGCGLVAALAAAQKGLEVLLLEKSPRAGGNTSKSTGMVIGAATRFQKEAGLSDTTPEALLKEIYKKNRGQCDLSVAEALAQRSGALVEWMVDDLDVDLRLVTDFRYPGHGQLWMHAPPARTGAEIITDLLQAAKRYPNLALLTDSPVVDLVERDGSVVGAVVSTGDREVIAAKKVILCANGFGGNPSMVERYCPEIAGALYFGHEGNTGEAILWGQELGAALDNMSAYQGHACISHPYGVPVTWATVMNGGFLVGKDGRRFGDETAGYSEYAREVLKQPEGLAYIVMDERIRLSAMDFEDMKECMRVGVFRTRDTIEELAVALHVDPVGLSEELRVFTAIGRGTMEDRFGRRLDAPPLEPPFVGTRLTGSLYHTQGGLRVDANGRVLRGDGTSIPNLYAGGGTAAGISGNSAEGYYSGNGLFTALGMGKLASEHAAKSIRRGE